MNKNFPSIKQSTQATLTKSAFLLGLTKKILTKKIPLEKRVAKITDDQNRVIEFEDNIEAWIDKDTGLMWEVKTEENMEHKYVWSEDWIAEAYYPEYLTDDVKDAFSYAKNLNTQRYGGFNDWRIPDKEELRTILTVEEINNNYIKAPLSKNSSSYYWSSSTYERNKYNAWVVYFSHGYVYAYTKNSYYRVRCVREGQ